MSKFQINLEVYFIDKGYEEMIVPSIWEENTFLNKVGQENANMMWRFKDKGNRDVCLIPEVTGLIQQQWNETWKYKNNWKIFYIARCYRYENPQKGRYREFTQIGVEWLGNPNVDELKFDLQDCLNSFITDYTFIDNVKRGLNYYTEDGFEAKVEYLGAQKQIAGGGRYLEGAGWAIGLDRLLLALEEKNKGDL